MTLHEATPTVLVTGATGNVGSQTVELLLAAGVPIRAAASSVEARSRFGDRVEAVALDFTDPATWGEAYCGVRRMFLMRPPHLGKPKKQMLPSLEVAKAAGVEHVVLLSLQGAEHNKVVPHHALEVWLRSSCRTSPPHTSPTCATATPSWCRPVTAPPPSSTCTTSPRSPPRPCSRPQSTATLLGPRPGRRP